MKYLILFFVPLLISCYQVNKKTSEISTINVVCTNPEAWKQIQQEFAPDITHPELVEKIQEIRDMPFVTEVLYFKSSPEELIAIANDHYSIRYVYNKSISNQILNGLSPQLNENEKKRISSRIQSILEIHQCYERKK